jgi:hypothetical protein
MTSLKKRVKMNDIKKTSTLENKHRIKIKEFELEKDNLVNLENELINIKEVLSNKLVIYTQQELKKRADLLDRKDTLEYEIDLLKNNTKEMDYYDKTGDILTSYYNIKENEDSPIESINILSILGKKKVDKTVQEIGRNKLGAARNAPIFAVQTATLIGNGLAIAGGIASTGVKIASGGIL